MSEEGSHLAKLRDLFFEELAKKIPDILLNGPKKDRLPHNLNVSIPGIKASELMSRVREVAFSSGSACASGEDSPSYVLKAMGFSEERAKSSLRFGLGRWTTEMEIREAASLITKAVQDLRHF